MFKRMVPMLLVLCVAGCVEESPGDGVTRFHYAWWVPGAVLLGGAAVVALGLLLRRRAQGAVWILFVGGPALAIFFAPSLYREEVRLTETGFNVRSGIWGMTARQGVDFGDVHRIRVVREFISRRYTGVLICERRFGDARLVLNNDVKTAAAQAILSYASARGIRVLDAR